MEASTVKVLLIDDEPYLLDVSKQFLELDRSITADTTSSAVLAFDLIASLEYDVVVSDYQMPGKDGIQLLKEIREMGNVTPFILFTGKGREEVAIEALNSGADFYLQKGGDPKTQFKELSNMIKKAAQRRRMELDIVENEEKFENIFNSANDVIFILNPEGSILEINQVGCNWLGYTKQEMLQKNVREIDSEHYAKLVPGQIKEVMERGFALFEIDWVTRSGKLIPVEVSARKINYAGRPAILSVTRDVSERKRTEEILVANELKFRMVADYTYDWEFWIDPSGHIVYCSPSCERITGYSHEELCNDPDLLLEMVHPEDKSRLSRHFETEVKAGPLELDFRIITRNGEIRWFSHACQAVFDDTGRNIGRRVSNRDITERKRAEEAARESELHYQKLFNTTVEGIAVHDIICDADGIPCDYRFIEMNPAYEKMTGLEREKAIGRTMREVLPDTEPIWIERYGRVALTGVPNIFEQYAESLGKHFQVSVFRNAPQQFTTSLTDVTGYRLRERLFRAHLKISEYSKGHSVDELLQKALDEAEELTASKIGFLHFVDDDQESLHLQMWSTNTITRMCSAEGKGQHYSISKAGVWVDCVGVKEPVVHNDIDSLPHRKGFPKGHAPVKRELVVPVLRNEKVKTIFGVGNKETDYNQDDVNIVRELANLVWDITERKQAEEALKLKDFAIFSSINAIAISDLSGNLTDVNPAFLKIWGQEDRKEVLGRPVSSFWKIPDQAQKAIEGIQLHGNWSGEMIGQRKDGTQIDVQVSANLVRDSSGTPVAMMAAFIDITTRKRSEEAARESEKKYHLVVESANIAIVVLQDGMVRMGNPAIIEIMGYSEQELKSKPFLSFIHPDDLALVTDRYRRRLNGELVPSRYEVRLTRKDGSVVWTDVSVVAIDWEGRPATLNFLMDITERKRTEAKLQESEERYRQLFEMESYALVLVDKRDGQLLEMNRAAEQMYGFSRSELLQMKSTDLSAQPEETTRAMKESATSIPLRFHRKKDDSVFPVEITGTNFDWHGIPVLICAIRDITERVRAGDALHEANRKLNLLSSITRHDISNQLMALEGNLTLLEKMQLDQASSVHLLKAQAASKHISTMIKFAKEYEDIGVQTPTWQDIHQLVKKGADDFVLDSVKVLNDVPLGNKVFADPLIVEVFHNLIDNAVRHGGKTTAIHFFIEEHDGAHTIICEDDGVGIPMEIKESLFRHGSEKGNGLGLFLSREILQITGITVEEVSEPGKGAKFLMIVPSTGFQRIEAGENE